MRQPHIGRKQKKNGELHVLLYPRTKYGGIFIHEQKKRIEADFLKETGLIFNEL